MLRVAVPNKGALSESAASMLKEAGYRGRRESKELVVVDRDNDVEFFFLRPKDIAVYVGSGTLDLGITGRDLLLDSGSSAVETAVTLGVADVIADVVETGTTLRNAGLEVFGEPILTSEAVLIRPDAREVGDAALTLVRRLEGVLTARNFVMMDYDIEASLVERAAALTPGLESPTVSPLHDPNKVAVRAMVNRKVINHVMDELYALGARAILVTDIAACRL